MRQHLLRFLFFAAVTAGCAGAHRLPIQVYTTAQGLPRNNAICLAPDPNGLLWICTSEGLSRFDGSEFRTFDVRQGLASPLVLDFFVAHDSSYWVVTLDGICRLPPGAKTNEPCRLLTSPNRLGGYGGGAITETSKGEILVATTGALYRATADGQRLERLVTSPAGESFETLGHGPGGVILMGTDRGLYGWDGRQARPISGGKPCGFGDIRHFSEHDTWVLSACGMFRVVGTGPADARMEKVEIHGSNLNPSAVVRRRDGSLWVGIGDTLFRLKQSADGSLYPDAQFGSAEGLPHQYLTMLTEDSQGNLWGASEGLGIFRIAASGFQAYYDNDGLGSARMSSIFETAGGELCVTTTSSGIPNASRSHLRVKNGDRFDAIDLGVPPDFHDWGWGWNQFGLQARDGEWWFPMEKGLYRYAAAGRARELNRRAPLHIYDRDEEGPFGEVFRVFEDSHADIWFSTLSPNSLIRWERASGTFHRLAAAEGWPKNDIATVIREARSGALWIGTFDHLFRMRGGRVENFTPKEGFSFVRDLHIDGAGRVWVASANHGVFRCDNPDAETPVLQRYTTKQGLSANAIRSLTEDGAGMIYAGTVRAVDRIDPRAPVAAGNIRHYTAADGLPDGEQNVAAAGRDGHLWFGTLYGLAEFDPALDQPHSPSRVYVRRVRVRGEEVPLPYAGAASVSLDLPADKNQVEIEYAAADLGFARTLRYQYRLQGVDADWSAPSARSSVNYANLPSGRRSFLVRAVGPSGETGQEVATIALELAAPLWRRWWFLMAASFSLAALVYWGYHYRVRNLLAFERLRTRIATDLHDDIGASLTQISLLSEVGQRDASRNVLEEIAGISRDLVQEMSDIVWAVSPRHDRFDALAHRMRRFAEDALPDGQLAFDTSGLPGDLSLAIEYRRPLFLVFKAAVNNVSRHSKANRMTVRLAVSSGVLTMQVEDNGRGFDPALPAAGEGLSSIQRRLKAVGGIAHWQSAPGQGTLFTVTLPLRR